ncbi:hypothetical protein EMPS_10745 [Entomortierella parvispora]|uniref:Uncharacterized protein n=1 Tax=Entomortierella parvispora TaxID=205924 RepID=A0A9P3M1A9_9FUNG|nr:hypothetical protein EMPS_10745 [Entomortierella parvispora]
MKSFRSQGRPKASPAKVSAPVPMNLPSRRQEKGHEFSLVSPASSWGSPTVASSAVLTTTSASSSPAVEGTSPQLGTASLGDSPQPETLGGSPLHKAAPRAWGVVAPSTETHVEDYPTAAEAAKKVSNHEHHDHAHSSTTTTNSTTATNSSPTTAKKSTPPASTSAPATSTSEVMSKSISTLSTENNWDEVDDDEGMDFLNAGAIEFADGSVIVTAAVPQPEVVEPRREPAAPPVNVWHQKQEREREREREKEREKERERERDRERVVERGEVDFNRAWPNRGQPSPAGPYPANPDLASRHPHERPHPPLWQGAPGPHREGDHGGRRPSYDRSQGPYGGQRRESLGNEDRRFPRRESAGGRNQDPYSGPRRDSRDNVHERRESFSRQPQYGRDRDVPYEHNRPHPTDHAPDRYQRDVQVLSRPKDSMAPPREPPSPSGSLPPPRSGRHDRQESMPPHDVAHRIPGYAHLIPPGVVEFDRPPQVTEDQQEAMKHSAEEARKRRADEERQFEEAKARARARADELAKKMEEAKLAKEKEAREAKEAQEAEEKKKLQIQAELEAAKEAARKEREALEAEAKRQANAEKQEAARKAAGAGSMGTSTTTSASAIPSHDRKSRSIREDAPEHVKAFGDPHDRPTTRDLNDAEKKDAIAQWQMLPQKIAKEEAERVARIREARRVEDERVAGLASVSTSSRTANSANQPATANKTEPWRRSNAPWAKKEDKPRESVADQANEAPKVTDEAVPATEPTDAGSVTRTDATESDVSAGTLPRTEAAKQDTESYQRSRATRSQNAVASREELKEKRRTEKTHRAQEETPVLAKTADGQDNMQDAGPKTSKDAVRHHQPEDRYGPGKYPAKLCGAAGPVTIHDISKIHSRLSKQHAGAMDLEAPSPASEPNGTRRARAPAGLAASTSGTASKRGSLSHSAVATIFPTDVERAAKNRGSLSFMVDSEIDSPAQAEVATATLEWTESTSVINPQSDPQVPASDAKRAWDSAQETPAPQVGWGSADPQSLRYGAMGGTGSPWMTPFFQGFPAGGPQPMQGPPMYLVYPPPHGSIGPPMAPFPVTGVAMPSLSSLPVSSPLVTGTEGESTANSSVAGTTNAQLGHHWLPRFSAAGDAPVPTMAPVPHIVAVPVSQDVAAAAASINRAPQSRPYGGEDWTARSSGVSSHHGSESWSSSPGPSSPMTHHHQPHHQPQFRPQHHQHPRHHQQQHLVHQHSHQHTHQQHSHPLHPHQQQHPMGGHSSSSTSGGSHRGSRGGFSGYTYREFRPRGA